MRNMSLGCMSDEPLASVLLFSNVNRTSNPTKIYTNMNKLKYLAAILVGIAGLGLQQANAATLDLSDSMHWSTNDANLIGTVIPGLQGQGGGQAVRDAAMTDTLLGMAGGSQQGTWGDKDDPLYSRTTWPGGPAATAAGAQLSGPIADGGATLTITLTQTFQYLVVSYDGPNGGTAVFDVSSLAVGDEIVLARYARPDAGSEGDLVPDDFFKMTHWTLLNPTGGVPDGGATVMLLGAGLG